jgi:hypothetical protein
MTDPWAKSSGTTDVSTSDDDLQRLLADRAPRRRLPWVTALLVAAILLSVGYVAGGYHYSHSGSSGNGFSAARGAVPGAGALGGLGNAAPGAGSGSSAGGTGSAGGSGPQAGAGGATIGTVKLVDGNNVYLTTTSGATVKVTLAKGGTVAVSKKGSLADLTPGSTVVVVGRTASDGTVIATAVTEGGGFGASVRG